jgi:hypothetical protein
MNDKQSSSARGCAWCGQVQKVMQQFVYCVGHTKIPWSKHQYTMYNGDIYKTTYLIVGEVWVDNGKAYGILGIGARIHVIGVRFCSQK